MSVLTVSNIGEEYRNQNPESRTENQSQPARCIFLRCDLRHHANSNQSRKISQINK